MVAQKGSIGLKQKIPQHVAIIMDGNGRWAQSRDLSRSEGHLAGVVVAKDITKACVARKIRVLSLWAFGQENWARPADEVDFLMELFATSLTKEVDELHQNGVRLRFTGDRTRLVPSLCQAMQKAEALTASNQTLTLNVVINYSGKWDITQATQRICEQAIHQRIQLEDINEALFSNYLCMSDLPDPDLFIRTSGEQRISNFFLWQLSYTELYFSPVYWPDFTTDMFDEALHSFQDRERRYGKTSAQLDMTVDRD